MSFLGILLSLVGSIGLILQIMIVQNVSTFANGFRSWISNKLCIVNIIYAKKSQKPGFMALKSSLLVLF